MRLCSGVVLFLSRNAHSPRETAIQCMSILLNKVPDTNTLQQWYQLQVCLAHTHLHMAGAFQSC